MLNYIIATYSANKLEFSLHTQLLVLHNLLLQKAPKYLSQITVVCPQPKKMPHRHYYNKDVWTNLFSSVGVRIVYLDYLGDNINSSYDQWIQGYLTYPDFDYYILMEDDYCFDPTLVHFDEILVNRYNSLVEKTNGVGYLCTLGHHALCKELHAAISNGILNRKTFETIGPDILRRFYAYAKSNYCQMAFSYLFLRNKQRIPILSMHEEYRALFWETNQNKMKEFMTKPNVKKRMIIPIQYLTSDVIESVIL
jgi:hypothetical protein